MLIISSPMRNIILCMAETVQSAATLYSCEDAKQTYTFLGLQAETDIETQMALH